MSSPTVLESKLLSENIDRKNFVDTMRLDIVNGREVSEEQVKEAIKYLQEDSKARGDKQVKSPAAKKPAAKKVSDVDVDDLLGSMF